MNSQELTMIKFALNKEDINYKTLFENTLNVAEAYALGNNGAIIEVAETDYDRSKKILSDLGIDLDYDIKEDRFEFINTIEKATNNIPIIGRWSVAYRFFLFAMTTIVIIISIILINTLRISKNDLIGNFWCVEKIIHNGVELIPNTKSYIEIIRFNERCTEDMIFHDFGRIDLPGFNTYETRGKWNFKSNSIFTISGLKDFDEIYGGEYTIKSNWNGTMEFVSDKTTIKISNPQ